MKSSAYLILFVLSLFSCGHDNKSLSKDHQNDSLVIDTISQKSTDIENLTPMERIKNDYQILQIMLTANKLDSTKISYENDETSGEVVFYKGNDSVKIIKYKYAEHSHFSAEEHYYIKNGNLFFVFLEETVWSFDGGTPEKPETKDDITEKRFYFEQNNPIECLEKKYTIRSQDSKSLDVKNSPNKMVTCNANVVLKKYQQLLKNSDKQGKIISL